MVLDAVGPQIIESPRAETCESQGFKRAVGSPIGTLKEAFAVLEDSGCRALVLADTFVK